MGMNFQLRRDGSCLKAAATLEDRRTLVQSSFTVRYLGARRVGGGPCLLPKCLCGEGCGVIS